MAIKGRDLAKMLPEGGKKNCKECGFPTCFAFAMKLSKKQADIDKCPYVSEETKTEIRDALAPPMAKITIGAGETALELGEEEVMYRHEKTFLRQPGIAVLVSDRESDESLDDKLRQIRELVFERVQEMLKPDLLALKFDSGDRARFKQVAERAYETLDLPAVILSEDVEALLSARDVYLDRRPLIYPVTTDNLAEVGPEIEKRPTPVGVRAQGLDNLIPLIKAVSALGVTDIVLDSSPNSISQAIQDHTIIRRAALKHGFRTLGFPTIVFPCFFARDPTEEILLAGALVPKYSGIVVISSLHRKHVFPLLIQRMDIYSDPRKLRTVEAKVYEFNNPGDDAPVMVTTNFALTYFGVSAEAEASRVPTFLAVVDTKGLGVQTAMGAGRFTGDTVAKCIRDAGLEERLRAKRLILPWIASRVKNELVDTLPDWEVLIGPKALNKLSGFLNEKSAEWGR